MGQYYLASADKTIPAQVDENGDIVKPQIGAVMDLLLSAIEIDVEQGR